MDYTLEKLEGFEVIGFEEEISYETAYEEIPKLWDAFCTKCMNPLYTQEKPEDTVLQVVCDCKIGEYGICIDDTGKEGIFRYMIAGTYKGGTIAEGMKVYKFPDMEWAKFNCTGPMPGALQSVNTKIFKEWLPNNPDFEIAMGANIEWYSLGDNKAPDYESAIWIPLKRK